MSDPQAQNVRELAANNDTPKAILSLRGLHPRDADPAVYDAGYRQALTDAAHELDKFADHIAIEHGEHAAIIATRCASRVRHLDDEVTT